MPVGGVIPHEITAQVERARDVIAHHLGPGLRALHLYGSALHGGLKPLSDIDLLVTVDSPIGVSLRRALSRDLLRVSAWPGSSDTLRALEATFILHRALVPWRYPPERELQFGEWLREDIAAGVVPGPTLDTDLAILLTQACQHSIALHGADAAEIFEPVPERDFRQALGETLGLWRAPGDWAGDERNVVLALSRIWHSLETGRVVPKDVAAGWAIGRMPKEHRSVPDEARRAYLGLGPDRLALRPVEVDACISFLKSAALRALGGAHRLS